jgi:hypothetical protein
MKPVLTVVLLFLLMPALAAAQQTESQQTSPCMPGMKMPGCPEPNGQAPQQGNFITTYRGCTGCAGCASGISDSVSIRPVENNCWDEDRAPLLNRSGSQCLFRDVNRCLKTLLFGLI